MRRSRPEWGRDMIDISWDKGCLGFGLDFKININKFTCPFSYVVNL